jgi:hypothetical protein
MINQRTIMGIPKMGKKKMVLRAATVSEKRRSSSAKMLS